MHFNKKNKQIDYLLQVMKLIQNVNFNFLF